ncbi:RecT family [Kluyvera cryocrescens]|uniref:RecT family n=1 Tax=Kluyvera cryocrescens TaxID=580 RepID=A0A485ASV5_KLUCR|nr:RecT family [Kluyvera cryocrescens]
MADSKATVPAHLAGKPADCLAVTMQAAQWGMNPFAVAQKTHVVNGTLGYEAQLVNAVVSSSQPAGHPPELSAGMATGQR